MSGVSSNPAGKFDLLLFVCAKWMGDIDQGRDSTTRLPSQTEPKEDGDGRHLNSCAWGPARTDASAPQSISLA